MPFVSVTGLRRMAAMNGTDIPADLAARLERVARRPGGGGGARRRGGHRPLRASSCAAGAPGIHLYTLNRSGPVRAIWDNLGD